MTKEVWRLAHGEEAEGELVPVAGATKWHLEEGDPRLGRMAAWLPLLEKSPSAVLPNGTPLFGEGDFRPITIYNGSTRVQQRLSATKLQRPLEGAVPEEHQGWLGGRAMEKHILDETAWQAQRRQQSRLAFTLFVDLERALP